MSERKEDEGQSPNITNQEEKFLSRLLSKEDSKVHSSSRVYYYGGAAVPFVWETRPGTPKHTLFTESSGGLPPLTPPPSYFFSSGNLSVKKRNKNNNIVKSKQLNLFSAILFRRQKERNSSLKNHVSPRAFSWSSTSSSTLSSSSSSSISSSSQASPRKVVIFMKKCRLSCSRSPAKYVGDDGKAAEKAELDSSPTSTLCYKTERRDLKGGKGRFGSSLETIKRALFSVLSHGSNGQDLIDDPKKI